MVRLADFPTVTFPNSTVAGLAEILAGTTAVPIKEKSLAPSTGVVRLTETFPEVDPAVVGANRTVTTIDWPGPRLYAPPPLWIENGAEVLVLPVTVVAEETLVIVIV